MKVTPRITSYNVCYTKLLRGDTKTSIIQTQSLVNNGYSNHKLVTGMHAGTHIDTPMHLTASPDYMHQFPLDIFSYNFV